MANDSLSFKYLENISDIEKGLEGVNAATLPELAGVVSALYSFLQMLESQDPNWQKLRHRLRIECPNFIPKVQYSFIYYYTKCLEKRYVPNDEVINSSKQLTTNMVDFTTQISKGVNGEIFKYFKELFSGKAKAIEANELVANFIEDTFEYQGDLLGVKDFNSDPSHMTIEDFFSSVADRVIGVPEEDRAGYIIKARHSDAPEIKVFSLIVDAIAHASVFGGAINNSNVKNKITAAINEIETEAFAKAYRQFMSDYGGVEIGQADVDKLLKTLNGILQEVVRQKNGKAPETPENKLTNAVEHDTLGTQYMADPSQTTGGMEDLAAKIGQWVLQQYPGEELKSFLNQNMNAQPKL